MATIAFRTTASKQIGFGHLRRCLTLAGELRRAGGAAASVYFWIDGDPAAVAVAAAAGFQARLVSGPEPDATAALLDAGELDTLVVDSYAVTPASFSAWRPRAGALVVIDDLADRELDVDVVVNGSPYAAQLSYRTAPDVVRLLGPRYALLRPIFRELPRRPAAPRVARVLVTLGGADPHSSTTAVVEVVQRALPGAALDVVVGPLFGPVPELDRRGAGDRERLRLHRDLDDLSPLMSAADLAVSGGGQTLYELAATGVPTVALCLADNQEPNIAALAGVSLLPAGRVEASAADRFRSVEEGCGRLAADPALRQRMSDAGRALIDGQGAARVADVILRSGHRPRSIDHGST
ncbi:MAG TPA: UDP-2,4-diacetamido-2,4,6-trideoxy-beta-L-altropyranose hydrolase [Polyangia bacterium]|jgi:UDP-2,4-diacetamido-2,4,6-trideoxy-beta-L-altropyranose hydrolase